MDVDSIVISLKQIFTQFASNNIPGKDVQDKLQSFRNSDNWAVCQKILSEPCTPQNQGLMIFCASCCSAYIDRYWNSLQPGAKEGIRTFLWQFVSVRISGESAVPFPLLNTMIKVCFCMLYCVMWLFFIFLKKFLMIYINFLKALVDVVKFEFPDLDSSLFPRIFQLISESCPGFSSLLAQVETQTSILGKSLTLDLTPLLNRPEPAFIALTVFESLLTIVTNQAHSSLRSEKKQRIIFSMTNGEYRNNFYLLLRFIELLLNTYCSKFVCFFFFSFSKKAL